MRQLRAGLCSGTRRLRGIEDFDHDLVKNKLQPLNRKSQIQNFRNVVNTAIHGVPGKA